MVGPKFLPMHCLLLSFLCPIPSALPLPALRFSWQLVPIWKVGCSKTHSHIKLQSAFLELLSFGLPTKITHRPVSPSALLQSFQYLHSTSMHLWAFLLQGKYLWPFQPWPTNPSCMLHSFLYVYCTWTANTDFHRHKTSTENRSV